MSLGPEQRRQTDQMVAVMARLIQDGDLLAEGIGTFLPTAAYMLAKRTHAPRCTSLCPNGNTLVETTRTLTLGRDEFTTIAQASSWLDYAHINLLLMPGILLDEQRRWTEFMRPAQIDAYGATNNVCIGPHARPHVRLPGSAGIPDASTAASLFYYYVPRHTARVFVRELDFCSGAGFQPQGSGGPRRVTVITNLCVMATGPTGRLQVTQLHPGVTREQVQEHTGFELAWADHVAISEPLRASDLDLLDTEIDPQGLRFLEVLAGPSRRQRLRQLAIQETSRVR